MKNINELLKTDPLVQLVQKENFIGWVYSINYESACVLSNDLWKHNAKGIPHNCFLIATTFDPESYAQTPVEDREIILLRVTGSCKLPQDDDLVRTKIDHCQQQTDAFKNKEFDEITLNQMQFGGLECRVLGTFYMAENKLWLGSDLESFAASSRLRAYRPRKEALNVIVNYVDPLRKQKAIEESKALGIEKPIDSFPIGTVRYTSTARLHRQEAENVVVQIQPSDFVARRTAVFGMTRTGKSNMIKQMVAVVKQVANQGDVKIGQIIFDINGEYANANSQDKGSIADLFPKDTIRYRMLPAQGFLPLQNNFYTQLTEGFMLISDIIIERKRDTANDVKFFLNMSLEKPEQGQWDEIRKWQIRVAAYQALLKKADFKSPEKLKVVFKTNEKVRKAVNDAGDHEFPDPSEGLSIEDAVNWFLSARKAAQADDHDVKKWLDDDIKAMLNLMAGQNEKDSPIAGYRILADARNFHSPLRTGDVGQEIYHHLLNGKIVILDLTVGRPSLRERITVNIAKYVFDSSAKTFVEGKTPPNILIYVEEAHNLIGKNADLDETWPRIAKEGAKYKIGLVYATQEVSAMHPNVLANTENWFITHLNNEKEIAELASFYDFEDFRESLIRAQDVGFARVKTLSSPYVIPVQIDKFDPQLLNKV